MESIICMRCKAVSLLQICDGVYRVEACHTCIETAVTRKIQELTQDKSK